MTRRQPKRVAVAPGELSCENCEGTGQENMGPVPGNLLLDVYRWCCVCEGRGTLPACVYHPDRVGRLNESDDHLCSECWAAQEAAESRFIAGI